MLDVRQQIGKARTFTPHTLQIAHKAVSEGFGEAVALCTAITALCLHNAPVERLRCARGRARGGRLGPGKTSLSNVFVELERLPGMKMGTSARPP